MRTTEHVIEGFWGRFGAVGTGRMKPDVAVGLDFVLRGSKLAIDEFGKQEWAGTLVARNGLSKPIPMNILVSSRRPEIFLAQVSMKGREGRSIADQRNVVGGDRNLPKG